MAGVFVKVTEIRNGAGQTATGAVTWTTGNALFAAMAGFSTSTITGYAVTNGGTWTTDATQAAVSSIGSGLASNPSATGTGATVQAQVNGTGASGITAFIYEFSGMLSSGILDAVGVATSGNSATCTTPALTNVQADAVYVAAYSSDSFVAGASSSTGTGWVMPAGGSELDGTTQLAAGSAYKIVSSVAAQTETWTITSAHWAANTCSYMAVAAAAAITLPLLPPPVRFQFAR